MSNWSIFFNLRKKFDHHRISHVNNCPQAIGSAQRIGKPARQEYEIGRDMLLKGLSQNSIAYPILPVDSRNIIPTNKPQHMIYNLRQYSKRKVASIHPRENYIWRNLEREEMCMWEWEREKEYVKCMFFLKNVEKL